MTRLIVEHDGDRRALSPNDVVTFGRDPSCTISFGKDDRTISRHVGQIHYLNGLWWITNLSSKRVLDIYDATGFHISLPVSEPGLPQTTRAIDQSRLTVVVVGTDEDHELVLRPEALPASVVVGSPTDPVSTITHDPRLTELRREVLVAMARGYLRTGPHHDPNPLTYAQVATLLGLSQATVMKRVQAVRDQLVKNGVVGLQVNDARRALCEWLLKMRWIGPQDIEWLQQCIDAARARKRPNSNQ
jgi:hypothetical protein